MKRVSTLHPLRLTGLFAICLVWAIATPKQACAQDDNPLSLDREEEVDSGGEGGALKELFDRGKYFSDEEQDSLAELLQRARELDESTQRDDATEEVDDREATKTEPDDESSADDESLDQDDIDARLDGEGEESSQAEEEQKARAAKHQATIQHLQRLQRRLSSVRVSSLTRADQESPENLAASIIAYQSPEWVTGSGAALPIASRTPTEFCHRPLYFEEIDLERSGRGFGILQNAVSASHFLFNTAVAPYRLATQRADQLTSSRGDRRSHEQFGLPIEPLVDGGSNSHGVLTQAAAAAGFTFLLL